MAAEYSAEWGFSAEELAELADEEMRGVLVEPHTRSAGSASPFWSRIFGSLEQHAEVASTGRVTQVYCVYHRFAVPHSPQK